MHGLIKISYLKCNFLTLLNWASIEFCVTWHMANNFFFFCFFDLSSFHWQTHTCFVEPSNPRNRQFCKLSSIHIIMKSFWVLWKKAFFSNCVVENGFLRRGGKENEIIKLASKTNWNTKVWKFGAKNMNPAQKLKRYNRNVRYKSL